MLIPLKEGEVAYSIQGMLTEVDGYIKDIRLILLLRMKMKMEKLQVVALNQDLKVIKVATIRKFRQLSRMLQLMVKLKHIHQLL